MPEARFDPLGRRWVLVAPERARRGAPPYEPDEPDPEPCDFCEGREHRTPPEVAAVRDSGAPDTPGWRARAVPNLYPATDAHEVVVHTPDHRERFEDLDPDHRRDVMLLYRERLRVLTTASVIVALNRGRAAGASRTHAHGQIFGLGLVPGTLAREVEAFAADPCVLCEATDLRVAEVGSVVLAAHPAPLVAHEVLIVPPCSPRFTEADDGLVADLGEAIAQAFRRMRGALGDGAPANLVIHTAPEGVDRFHWHAHLYPRTATWGALEVGAELAIAASDPEDTAARFRDAGA